MELPNKSKAYIPANKITAYLLSETHAVGAPSEAWRFLQGESPY
jgi:hypothetical protein